MKMDKSAFRKSSRKLRRNASFMILAAVSASPCSYKFKSQHLTLCVYFPTRYIFSPCHLVYLLYMKKIYHMDRKLLPKKRMSNIVSCLDLWCFQSRTAFLDKIIV